MKYDHRFTLKTREESIFLFKESDMFFLARETDDSYESQDEINW